MDICTKEEVAEYQNIVTMFSMLARAQDDDLLQKYLAQTRPQADGTLDAVLPHFFSSSDMEKAKHNLKILRGIGEHILEIKILSAGFGQ